jgi:uncharacterized protein
MSRRVPTEAATINLSARCLQFGRYLRRSGIAIAPSQLIGWLHCLPHIDLTCRDEFRDASRTALVCRYEDLAAFERAFDRFWAAQTPLADALQRRPQGEPSVEPVWAVDEAEPATDDDASAVPDRIATFSPVEQLRRRDFGAMSAEELATVVRLARGLAWHAPPRRSRRHEAAPRGRAHDLRRSLHRTLRHGGDLLVLARRTRRRRPRPLVLLCDVSGSMAPYARILLQFLYIVARRRRRVEAFVFSTRLTRITRPLANGIAGAALDAAVAAASDWGGGTRIGAALRTFNVEWVRRVAGRGAIVIVVSDGCDRGDAALLAQEIARLHRSCYRLIWLNPWLGQTGYAPEVRGMQAALPHVDDFLPVHNLASLEQLAAVLQAIT